MKLKIWGIPRNNLREVKRDKALCWVHCLSSGKMGEGLLRIKVTSSFALDFDLTPH